MGFFNFSHKWNFPSNNFGQIFGIADSGVETFKGTPIKSLAREICQNSLDAHLPNDQPTRIDFEVFEIASSDIPDLQALKDAFTRSLDFWSKQRSNKAKAFFRNALYVIEKPTITCLRISDHNTTGLLGSREEYNTPWCNLTKSTGASDKSGSNGGSFGIGKFAPFACSHFRTIFYSTADSDGVCAYQGVSRLTSFKNKRGDITQGIGFYGNERNTPIYQQYSLSPNFNRDEEDFGTDIFILGFNGDTEWKHDMIASILDGFLYAVYSNTLVVDVDGTLISQETLPDLIESHKQYFKEHAEEYYRTLTDEKLGRTFIDEITDDPETRGKLTLRLMIMPEFHRRAAMVRQTGMKIKDKGNINGLIPFAGLLFIEGDAINSYLRGLENPQHLEWEIERANNKSKAQKLLRYMTRFIKTSLDTMKNDDSEEALDPSVGEYLAAVQEEEVPNQEKTEGLQDNIKDIKIRVTEIRPKPGESQDNQDGDSLENDENGDVTNSDVPGENGSGGNNPGKGGGNGGGNNPGDGGGNNPTEHRKSLSSIQPSAVRSLVKDKKAGRYTIVFTPKISASNGILEVYMSAESQNYTASIVSASCADFPNIVVSNNKITNITFTEKQPIKIDITIDYHDYCSMEVKAYGNKV